MPRVTMITGCSRGIGLATALACAARGDHVIATLREPEGSDATRRQLAEAGASTEVVVLDVTSDASVDAAVAGTIERYGGIDVLVNNAGLGYRGTLEELSIADFQRCMEVNFLGAVRTMKAVLPGMRLRGSGRIINVSSIAGSFGQPFNDAYCAAKFALEGVCESLYPVARAFDVHVIVVEPGAVRGEFRDKSGGVDSDPSGPFGALRSAYDQMMSTAADGAASPEEIAACIVATIDDPAPAPRVQVPESTARLIGVKLKDLSGERVVGITQKWLR